MGSSSGYEFIQCPFSPQKYKLQYPRATGLSWASLSEDAVAEDSDTQEEEGVDIDNVPPEGQLRRVCELLL